MIYAKNTAKAIIVKNDHFLLLKKRYDNDQVIYTLPGGTQEPGESLEQAVIREVFEEVAAKVSVTRLVNIYEHQHLSKKEQDTLKHKIEFAFLCEMQEDYQPCIGSHPDPHQVAVEWIAKNSLHDLMLSPAHLSQVLTSDLLSGPNIYLGNVS